MDGYDELHHWLQDMFNRSPNNKPQMTKEERNKYRKNVAHALVKGAVALQFIGDRDFYCNNSDMEVMIKFKKDYQEMSKDEITFNLMKDVILLLEREEHQLKRIAATYDGN